MATPKTAAKVEETPSSGKAVVAEPVAAKPAVAAAPAPVVQAPKEAPKAAVETVAAPKATPVVVPAVKIEDAPKVVPVAPAAVVKSEEAPKAIVAAVDAKTPEAIASTSEEPSKVEETTEELPAETEVVERDLPEAAPVEPSIPEFAEESNLVGELKAHEKKSLEEFKLKIEKAIKENEFRDPKKTSLESTLSIKESEPIAPKELAKEITEIPATTETSPVTEAAETSEAVVEKVEEKSKDVSAPVTPAVEEKVPVVVAAAAPAPIPVVAAAPAPTPVEAKATATEKSKEVAAPATVQTKPTLTEKAKETAAPAISAVTHLVEKFTEKAKEVSKPAVAAEKMAEKAKEVTSTTPAPVSIPAVKEKKAPIVEEKVTKKAEEVPATSAAPVVEKSKDVPVGAPPTAESEPVLETVTPIFVEDSDAVETTEVAQEAPVVLLEEEVEDSTPPEDISLWGVPLLHTKGDKRTDVILLKFLRARDFNVNQAFKQLKKTIIWRKKFKTDTILEEEFGTDLAGVAFMHGLDKEGHPVCYNVFGSLQDKELYQKTFGDSAKISAFIRWRVQFLEKGIRLLNFDPEGPSALVQIVDMKNTGFFTKKDIKSAVNQATDLLQDNYPEMVARKIFINAPWYFNALYSFVSPFLSQRSKSKFTVAPAGKTTEHLLKFISAAHIPVQYGGLSKAEDADFSGLDEPAHELTLKAGEKQSVEIPVEKAETSVIWDFTVVGYEVNYEAEFVPSAEGSYPITIEKSKKLPASTESPIRYNFKATEAGKVVLTLDNSSKKKKIVFYRSLVKAE